MGSHSKTAVHPYLKGNFAPVQKTIPLTPCSFTGTIPVDLRGGQYVRNGANPISNTDLGRDAHWFDGDGMLSGVLFQDSENRQINPQFVNQFILTDVLLSAGALPALKTPILPSITTLVNPNASLIRVIFQILRTLILVFFSFLTPSAQSIKRISVANTGLLYHNGRALATCESGPPIRIKLPGLETVGWFNGHNAEGECELSTDQNGFGGRGVLSFMKEWTTGHPKVDPITKQMVLYHCTFVPPYIHYSVLSSYEALSKKKAHPCPPDILNMPVPGVSGAKMMHDFGISRTHTVIMDLPLTLDPLKLLKGQPVVHYDHSQKSRYGVFPRHDPSAVRWFETSACCIFHTANCWDDISDSGVEAVNMLVCRLTSAALIFAAGNITDEQKDHKNSNAFQSLPTMRNLFSKPDVLCRGCKERHDIFECAENLCKNPFEPIVRLESQNYGSIREPHGPPLNESHQCRLYYYRFGLAPCMNTITHQFALSAIPLDFPTTHPDLIGTASRYVYGCSTTATGFCSSLGKGVKIDVLAKIDIKILLERGKRLPPEPITGCVDHRSVAQILQEDDPHDPIRLFMMPSGWYAQEARFVPRTGFDDEDEGHLLFYAFDESQLDNQGDALDDTVSELWVLDAKGMRDVVCRVRLPQRVPYGLHGCWFSKEEIEKQREIERLRSFPALDSDNNSVVQSVRDAIIKLLG